jgi:hypothetical protein
MRNAKMVVCLGAFAACVGVPSLGVAADNCSGAWVEVGMNFGNTIVSFNDDHSAPGHMALGVCDASTLRCTYKDKDGDTWTDDVSVAGTWKTVGGTGKYANATSFGWSKTIRAEVGPEGMIDLGIWGGNCK